MPIKHFLILTTEPSIYFFRLTNIWFLPSKYWFANIDCLANISFCLENIFKAHFKKMGKKSEFWIRGLGIQDLGLNQDPLLRKYAFLSITWVPAIRMEHVRAPLKDLSTRNVFCIGPMVICACGLLLNPAKVFNIGHDYTLWIRNFMVMMKKPENPDFETWPNGPRP
jgi:hypothetical protein